MGKKNDVIRRLKNDLHQIEQFSEEHIRRTKNDADKQQVKNLPKFLWLCYWVTGQVFYKQNIGHGNHN